MSLRYTPNWSSCSFSIQMAQEAAPELASSLKVLFPGSPKVMASMLLAAPREYFTLFGSTFIIIDAPDYPWQGRNTGANGGYGIEVQPGWKLYV